MDEDDYIFKKNKPFYVLAPEIANGGEHTKVKNNKFVII